MKPLVLALFTALLRAQEPAIRGGNASSALTDRNKTCDETLRVTVRDGAVSTVTLRPCL